MKDLIHKPIKLLLLDDEDKIRKLLRLCISWEEIGYAIVGDAASTNQALAMIPIVKPDVIITDIEMPLMNGLDFAQMIMQEYPHIKVIILTAHDVFQYAKKGLEIGISAFIVKPVKRDELRKIMENTKQMIYMERREIYELESLKNQLEENKEYIINNFLNNILLNQISLDKLEENLNYYKVPLHIDKGYYNVCLLMPEAKGDEAFCMLANMQCKKLISTTLQRMTGVLLFTDLQQNIVLISENHNINLNTYAAYFASQIQEKLDIIVYWGVGTEVKLLTDIRYSYKHAFQMVRAFSESHNKAYISTGKPDESRSCFHNIVQNVLENLPIALQIPSEDRAFQIIQTAYEQMERLEKIPFSEVTISSMMIVSIILSSLRNNGIPYSEIYHTDHLPYVHILKMKDIKEVQRYMIQLVSYTVHQIDKYADNNGNKLVHSIIQYINENIDQSTLSLKKISELNYANPSYVSRIFKEVTGTTFMDYLNTIRINKAKELLINSNLKIYEIAERVGIADANYFSKYFKKHTNYSPALYKDTYVAAKKAGNYEYK